MLIGTWNLAGRWRAEHEAFLAQQDCDVWLLTEVNERVELPGFSRHLSAGLMAPKRRWAGVYSRGPLQPLPDPHIASAAATVDGVVYCSSILPWRGATDPTTWPGDRHADRTAHTIEVLRGGLSTEEHLVWGGDWNHALSGSEGAGSKAGREHVLTAVREFGLRIPTADLPHRLDGILSIDHVAVPADWVVTGAARLRADGLSDHDAYVVDVRTESLTGTDTTG